MALDFYKLVESIESPNFTLETDDTLPFKVEGDQELIKLFISTIAEYFAANQKMKLVGAAETKDQFVLRLTIPNPSQKSSAAFLGQYQNFKLSVQEETEDQLKLKFRLDKPIKRDFQIGIQQDDDTKDLSGVNILLVEDNFVNQKVASKFLEKWKVNVTIAENGLQAINQVKENNFDLILMDIQMPVLDGFEATIAIRNMPDATKQNTPIIALTASIWSDVELQKERTGLNDYILKPFKPDVLFEIIQRYCSRIKN